MESNVERLADETVVRELEWTDLPTLRGALGVLLAIYDGADAAHDDELARAAVRVSMAVATQIAAVAKDQYGDKGGVRGNN